MEWRPSGWGLRVTRSPHWRLRLDGEHIELLIEGRQYRQHVADDERVQVITGLFWAKIDREAPEVVGARVQAFALDVTDSAAVDALVDRVESSIGPIALAASVAGVLHVGGVTETDDADWRRVFAVNADGVFHVGRALARVMSSRRQGAIDLFQ